MASLITMDLRWRVLLSESRAHPRWQHRPQSALSAAVAASSIGEALRHQLTQRQQYFGGYEDSRGICFPGHACGRLPLRTVARHRGPTAREGRLRAMRKPLVRARHDAALGGRHGCGGCSGTPRTQQQQQLQQQQQQSQYQYKQAHPKHDGCLGRHISQHTPHRFLNITAASAGTPRSTHSTSQHTAHLEARAAPTTWTSCSTGRSRGRRARPGHR